MNQSIKKTLTRGVAWMSIGATASKAIGVIYVVLILTHLSLYEYGLVELLISIPPLLGFLNLPGLELAAIADMGYEKGRSNLKRMYHIYASYLSIRFILGVAGWSMLFFAAPLVSSYYNEGIADMIRIISFSFLLSPFRSAFMIIFKASLRFKLLAAYSFVEELGKLIVLCVALFIFNLGPIAVIIAYVGADVVALVVFSFLFISTHRKLFQSQGSLVNWKDPLFILKAHGKWSILASYLGMFGQHIRPWVIKAFLGTEAVGLYGLAVGMYQHTTTLFSVARVVGPILPRYIEQKKKIHQLINGGIKYQILASLLSAVFMVSLFPILINTFFPSYAEAYMLYACLLAALIPTSFTSIFEPTFHALKAQRNLFFASILRLCIVILLLPIALSVFGLYGIALEFFVTRAVYSYNRYRKLCVLLPDYGITTHDIFSITDTDILLLKKINPRGWKIFVSSKTSTTT